MKKYISLILCLFIISAMLPYTTMAASNGFDGADSFIKFQTLQKLGVLGDEFSDITSEKNITRGQFAAMASRAFLIDYGNKPSSFPFSDVNSNTEFASAITNLYNLKILSGSTDGKFYPENPITVNEAVTVLLKLLGYTPMAEQEGGYPLGYQRTAQITKLVSSVYDYNDYLSGDYAVSLIYSAMTVDKMERNIGGEKETYEIKGDSNIFLSQYSLYYGNGIVTSNDITSLNKLDGSADNRVVIDGIRYYDTDGSARNLLGYYVEFLYKDSKDADEKELFSVCAGRKNSTVRINSEDIMLNGDRIYIDRKDNKDEFYTMDSNIYVIYNGKFHGVDFGYDWLPKYGYVTLIDNDEDNTYEVALVKNFENYVVSTFDYENEIIYDLFYNAKELKTPITENCIYYKNGVITENTVIQTYDVLSVCKSMDGTHTEVYISSSSVEGTVEMITDDGKTIINNTEYVTSPDFDAAVTKGDAKAVTVGSSGKFYLDVKGGIAHFVAGSANGMLYGYLIAATKELSDFKEPVIKIFNENGDFDILTIPRKVTVDETTELTQEQFLAKIKGGNISGDVQNQLVKYYANSNKEIKKMNFATADTTVSNSDLLVKSYDKTTRIWRPSSRSFDGVIGVSANTLVMIVPQNASEINEEKAYKAGRLSLFANDATYTFESYDNSDADVAKALVVYTDSERLSVETPVNVFEKAIKVLDEENNSSYKICYWQRGEYKETLLEDGSVLDKAMFEGYPKLPKGLEKGDAFRLGTNSSGKISKIFKLTDMSETNPVPVANPSHANFNQSFRVLYGKVQAIDGTNLLVSAIDGSWKENHSVHDTAKQTRYIYCDLTKNMHI